MNTIIGVHMQSKKKSTYTARPVDEQGNAAYTEPENQVWHDLIVRQIPIVEGRACDEYIYGMDLLNLPHDRIPQCHEVTKVLQATTGWSLEPVPALIPFLILSTTSIPSVTFPNTQ